MAHDDSTGEKRDDARESKELSHEVGEVSVEENEAGLLEGVLVERFQRLEQIAETEA